MTTRGETLRAPADAGVGDLGQPKPARLPAVVYVLALGTFLMGTTEFVVAGLLPEIASDVQVSVARAGLLITVFAVGMIVGAPLMALLTLRLPKRWTLVLALGVFAVGHVILALGSGFALLLVARFLTALATGAFWAVANVAAARAAGPAASSRALGVVGSGAMLANVVGVPLGSFAGQVMGWRGPFWALAVLSAAAMVLIARQVPRDTGDGGQAISVRSELTAVRSGRLWLALAACATTTGGVLATYTYISPLLTDRTHLAAGIVPLVLAGFGVGALAGFLVGGRLGDRRPYMTTIVAPAVTTLLLLALCLLSGQAPPTIVLVVLLGLFGLGANPVLIALSVRFAGEAPTLGSALTVSAFNLGTAIGSWIAGFALESSLGTRGPAAVGTVIAALTLIPTITIALTQRRSAAL
ncbi:MFS transporter [Streptomyces sp. NPDC005388]|uniref:MFS transporter n=1 Tax=Streptomyces sp. NPDC005388 TaxID=3156717 RepID=UPI0033ACC483